MAGIKRGKQAIVKRVSKSLTDDNGNIIINFGAHKGTRIDELAICHEDYARWILTLDGDEYSILQEEIKEVLNAWDEITNW